MTTEKEPILNDQTKANLGNKRTWKRALYMLIFTFIYGIAEFLTFVLILGQFLIILVTGKANRPMLKLGKGLSVFIYQILRYLTYNSEQHPFPFGDWPDVDKMTNTKQSHHEE